jgi:hypothetical protein
MEISISFDSLQPKRGNAFKKELYLHWEMYYIEYKLPIDLIYLSNHLA